MEQNKYSRTNGHHSASSHKKTSNVSYRSTQPASRKQVASSDGIFKKTTKPQSRTASSRRQTTASSRTTSTQNQTSVSGRTASSQNQTSVSGRTVSSQNQTSVSGRTVSSQKRAATSGRTSRTTSTRNQTTTQGRATRQNPSAARKGTSSSRSNVKRVTTHNNTSGTRTARTANYRPAPKKNKKRGCLGCFLPFLVFLILLVLVALFGVRHIVRSAFDKIDQYSLDYSKITVKEEDENIGDYENIALFGVDDQDNKIHDIGSRTDCMMIASINKKTKQVKLLSIYRDTYVSIDGKYDKINAAHSYGGPELALNTINRNLDLNITNFATVNFKALADTVDALEGIPLTVQSPKELENLNDYIHNMNNINGGDSPKFEEPDEYPFTATFDGNQAVAYSRIRYMAGGDHARASHQRLVVEGIMNAVKKKPWKLKTLIDVVLPQCKTSLSTSDMTRLSMSLLRYELTASEAYPFHSEDERYNGIYYGFPLTVYSNTIEAHEYLFGTKDYVPTEELGQISDKINVVTQDIGLN